MEALPHELVLDILSRLPTSSLHIIKLVCRSWRRLAEDPYFVTMHFGRMTVKDPCLILHSDYPVPNQLSALYLYVHNRKAGFVRKLDVPLKPEFQVVGSCDGLLCFIDTLRKNTFFVYNPFTGDCSELPKPKQSSDGWSVFGFGCDPSTEEYKVVKIDYGRTSIGSLPREQVTSLSKVEVLTMGTASWRSLGQISGHLIGSNTQVLVNGRLHWVTFPERYRLGRKIISLDMDDELFREVPKPDSLDLEQRDYNLLVLRGCISAAFYQNFTHFDIWVMRQYGVRESWVHELSIKSHLPRTLEQNCEDRLFKDSKFYGRRSTTRVLCGLNNGEVLLEYKCRGLVCYDPRTAKFRELGIEGMPNWFQAITYTTNISSFPVPVSATPWPSMLLC